MLTTRKLSTQKVANLWKLSTPKVATLPQRWEQFTVGAYPVWERVYTDHSWESQNAIFPSHAYKWATDAEIDQMIADANIEDVNVNQMRHF
jgi:hypothetical protein